MHVDVEAVVLLAVDVIVAEDAAGVDGVVDGEDVADIGARCSITFVFCSGRMIRLVDVKTETLNGYGRDDDDSFYFLHKMTKLSRQSKRL